MATVEENTKRHIETTGWSVVKVFEDDAGPGFAFTIGLVDSFRHPELLIVGLPLDVMYAVLNTAGEEIRSGVRYSDGTVTSELLENCECGFRSVPKAHYRNYLGAAIGHHRPRDFDALQVLWPDRDNHLPTSSECDAGVVRLQELAETSG